MQQFAVDQRVRITENLVGMHELNGQTGIIVRWNADLLRGRCLLDSGKTVTVYADELELVTDDEP